MKPPGLDRDYDKGPIIKALKRRRFIAVGLVEPLHEVPKAGLRQHHVSRKDPGNSP